MIVSCHHCQKEFDKRPDQIKKTGNNFCSRSCAAKHNNKMHPKRKKATPENTTCACGSKKDYRASTCRSCKVSITFDNNLSKTLYDTCHHDSASRAKYNTVRALARKSMERWGVEKKCEECGFDAYVEVCHIKPIASFSPDSLMSEVNSRENLRYLCPNHHVLLDKGLLLQAS